MRSRVHASLLALLAVCALPEAALAFCGFYVASGEAKLFNHRSQVALVRDGDRTVMTMASDYAGDPKEFALVVPVPVVLKRGQIHVGDSSLVAKLDAYSAPRLVEYFDHDPCIVYDRMLPMAMAVAGGSRTRDAVSQAKALGVTIEAQYTVGEYDILILSAQQSTGLETWLRQNGYRIPAGASEVIASYLKQNMRFFVAKVNLAEHRKLGFSYLRPLQVAYESPKFMLPIRLGMVNANGPQELFVYALTRKGRVETTNYRTVKLPADMDLPEYLKQPNEFASFYKAMFARQVQNQDGRAVFLEYGWDMRWCDPCAADPLASSELRQLGVFWTGDGGGTPEAFLTRLHVRYDNAHFPEDLVFQETGDRSNFQGRYVLRHPWTGADGCSAASAYRQDLRQRRAREAEQLAHLTGWNIADIRKKMGEEPAAPDRAWWERLWKQ